MKNPKSGTNTIPGSQGRKSNKLRQNDENKEKSIICSYSQCKQTISQNQCKMRKGMPFCSTDCGTEHFRKSSQIVLHNAVTQQLDPEEPVAPPPCALIENGTNASEGMNASDLERPKRGAKAGRKGPKPTQASPAMEAESVGRSFSYLVSYFGIDHILSIFLYNVS